MNTLLLIIGGILGALLVWFLLRLSYAIFTNLVHGRKFHHALEQEFSRLRLSRMLEALGINKTDYIYQSQVIDIQRHMDNCTTCNNTDICDDKLTGENLDITEIEFCNNESELKEIKQQVQ